MAKLKEELGHLEKTKRKEVSEKLKQAVSQGDLSENAAYDAAPNAANCRNCSKASSIACRADAVADEVEWPNGSDDVTVVVQDAGLQREVAGAGILGVQISDPEALKTIAQRSRKTPRVANRLLKRVRDFSQVRSNGVVDKKTAEEALKMLEIDQYGLEPADRHILEVIISKFNGGPVGLKALTATSNEEAETIADVHEPYLLQMGFLARTPRGRVATRLAYDHLGIKYDEEQERLF